MIMTYSIQAILVPCRVRGTGRHEAVIPCRAMSEVKMAIPTDKKTMAELRDKLDTALGAQFPGGMLKREWDGDVLKLSGPGAHGTIVLEDGQLVGRANLKPPASLMQAVISEKITSAIKTALA